MSCSAPQSSLRRAEELDAAGALIDMLITLGLRDEPGDWPLPSLSPYGPQGNLGLRPDPARPRPDDLSRSAQQAHVHGGMGKRFGTTVVSDRRVRGAGGGGGGGGGVARVTGVPEPIATDTWRAYPPPAARL